MTKTHAPVGLVNSVGIDADPSFSPAGGRSVDLQADCHQTTLAAEPAGDRVGRTQNGHCETGALATKLQQAEVLATVATYVLRARPNNIETAIKDAIHEVADIDIRSTKAGIPLKDWLCKFRTNDDALHVLETFTRFTPADLVALERDHGAGIPDALEDIHAIWHWIDAFVAKHGGRENVKSQILQFRPTVGLELLRRIQDKSLLTWALRRLSELLKQ